MRTHQLIVRTKSASLLTKRRYRQTYGGRSLFCKEMPWHPDATRLVAGILLCIAVGSISPARGFGDEPPNNLSEADRAFQRALQIWGSGTSIEAEGLLNRSLALRQDQLGPNDPKVAEVLERLGALNYNRGNYANAEALFRRALDIDLKALGEKAVVSAYLMGDLGAALREQGKYVAAQKIVEHSLALRRELLPSNDLGIAGSLDNLGRIYLAERRYSDARRCFQEALQIFGASLSPDHPRIRGDRALLEQIDGAEAGIRRLIRLGLILAGAAVVCLTALTGCSLWSERRGISNPADRPPAVKALGIASTIGLIGAAGFLCSVLVNVTIQFAYPSLFKDPYATRNIGKLGFFLGIWIAIIMSQVAANLGRRTVGLPTRPIVYFRWSSLVRRPSPAGSIALGVAQPFLQDRPDSLPWFIAMEYYALILNRTYKVFVTKDMLCGAKVRGLVSNPALVSLSMRDPRSWAQTNSAKIYDRIEVTAPMFSEINPANFQIHWGDIANVDFRAGKKWGMGNVPHSGRLIIHLRSGRRRELILLGEQDGSAIKERLDRLIAAGPAGKLPLYPG